MLGILLIFRHIFVCNRHALSIIKLLQGVKAARIMSMSVSPLINYRISNSKDEPPISVPLVGSVRYQKKNNFVKKLFTVPTVFDIINDVNVSSFYGNV